MTHKSNTIVWEKWKDPFGFDDEELSTLHEEKDDYHNDEDEDFTEKAHKTQKEVKCRFILTPFGMIPYTENTASSSIFNFWTGHTNFALTDDIVDVIENTDGVETLDVFTKYRFRIAIGKAFKDSSVMREVNRLVYEQLE